MFASVIFLFYGCHISAQDKDMLISKATIKEAFEFCKKNKMDSTYCIFVDLSVHSGKNRMTVWNFSSSKAERKSLCSHGSCNGKTGPGYSYDKAVVNNISESYCSSVGKYKIGKRGYSNWGTHFNYKLHGLDDTNSKAYDRIIVLHSYDAVQKEETYPDYLICSWGCPMVSNETMNYFDEKLKKSTKPVLLWMYN